jgi:hypothetical protein
LDGLLVRYVFKSLYGLLVLMLPSEGIFFVATNAASAGHPIGYRGIFWVEVLLIGV